MKRARSIQDSGCFELLLAVDRGTVAVNREHDIASPPDDEDRPLSAEGPAAVGTKARALRQGRTAKIPAVQAKAASKVAPADPQDLAPDADVPASMPLWHTYMTVEGGPMDFVSPVAFGGLDCQPLGDAGLFRCQGLADRATTVRY